MDTLAKQIADTILDVEQRDQQPQPGQKGFVRAFVQPSTIDEERRTMRFVCSTKDLDRYGEIVEPSAFEKWLPTFMENPLFLAGHLHIGNNGEPTSIGQWVDLQVTSEGLEGTAQFLDGDELAEQYWNRYRKGVQKAVSVGFIVHSHEMRDVEINGVTQRVRVFTEVELVEISAVTVPANRGSLVRAASAEAALASQTSGGSDKAADDGSTDLQKTIEQTVKREIHRCLDAGPGSPLASLFTQVVRAHAGGQGLGFEDEEDDLPPDPSEADEDEALDFDDASGRDSGGDDELNRELRDLLGEDDPGNY
jgi:HK97 family phage prohead protease